MFDVSMSDSKVLNRPMEFGLELMTVVSPDFIDAECKFVDGIGLGVFLDIQCSDTSSIIDSCILKAAKKKE